jgi:SAM-dependent methyltransferase
MNQIQVTNQRIKQVLEFYQSGTLESDVWFQIANKDYIKLLRDFNFYRLFSWWPKPIELLDIGCGTGKFPTMLREHLPPKIEIIYDYLDPSAYCLMEMKKALVSPYQPRTAFHSTFEELQESKCPANGYDIVWAIYSFCYLDYEHLAKTISKLNKLIEPKKGVALILLQSRHSFYNRAQENYKQAFYGHGQEPYLAIEDFCETMDALGFNVEVKNWQIIHDIPSADRELLEYYLQQVVLESRPLSQWEQNKKLWHFLQSFNDGAIYHFPQKLSLLMYSPDALKMEALKEL